MRIAGHVFGTAGPTRVRVFIDAPDRFAWSGPEVTTSGSGEFDFGPMRAGRYLVLAYGEVGKGVRVSGTVVDDAGRPIQGVHVDDKWRGIESKRPIDGRFEMTIHRQGRYRLRVLDDAHVELLPPQGRLAPAIDIASPEGTRDGVRIVVRRDAKVQRDSGSWGWGYDGYVELGASIENDDVIAVGDELAAAGLRAGDTIIATDPPRERYEFWNAQMVREGEATTITVLRDGNELAIRAIAPYFGPAEPRFTCNYTPPLILESPVRCGH